MTTILADVRRRVMVAESNVAVGECSRLVACKVFRLRGALVATSGDAASGEIFMRWYASGERQDDAKAVTRLMTRDEDFMFDALVLRADGLWHYDCPFPTRVENKYYAIGSGAPAALAAIETMRRLRKTVDPVLAVKIACEVDPNSRGPVRSYALGGRP